MNIKQQTAVEWLVTELNQKIDFIPLNKWDEIRDIVHQAKEMEKEQIIDSYDAGLFDGTMNDVNDRLYKQYYKETYEHQTTD